MSSVGSFPVFIQARDAAVLQVYMTNERHHGYALHLGRNNRALFKACRDGALEICELLISFGADVNSAFVVQQTPPYLASGLCRFVAATWSQREYVRFEKWQSSSDGNIYRSLHSGWIHSGSVY